MESLTTTFANETSTKKKFESLNVEERKTYAAELMQEVRGHVPVVLVKHKNATLSLGGTKKIMLVGSSLKVMNFMEYIKRRIRLHSSSSLFLFVNGNHLVKTGDLVGELYAKYASPDTFLYVTVSDKEVWG